VKLAELLTGIEALELDRNLPIWLATRTVKGQQIEGVEVVPVGGLSIDEDDQELLLISGEWVQADEVRNITTVENFCRWAIETQGQFADFLLHGVQNQIALPGGGVARSCDGLVGWLLPSSPTALWLLFRPLEQWPSEWFTP